MNATRTIRLLAVALVAATGLLAWIGLGGCSGPAGAAQAASAADAESHPPVDFDVSCKECHAETTPVVHEKWNEGRHGQVNVGCFVCHEDGVEDFRRVAPAESCRGCHDAQYESFVQSGQESCFVCHDGHTLTFHTR